MRLHVVRPRSVLVVVACLVAGVLSVVAPAVAVAAPAAPARTLTVAPGNIPAGTGATVTGTGCTRPANSYGAVVVSLTAPDGTVVQRRYTGVDASGAWQVTVTPSVSAAPGRYLVGATCDRYVTDFTYPVKPLLVRRSTQPAWSVGEPALPTVPNGRLNDVACSSSTRCVAVGLTGTNGVVAPLLQVWNGGTWRAVAVAVPSDTVEAVLYGVDCPSASVCVAVGDFLAEGGPDRGLVVRLAGDLASVTTLAPSDDRRGLTFSDVSCVSAATCTAVGTSGYLRFGSDYAPAAFRYSGGTWTETPTAAGVDAVSMPSVSCTSATWCAALTRGDYGSETPDSVQTWNGSTWQAGPALPQPTGRTGDFTAVSCTAPGVCSAVGSSTDRDQFWTPPTPLAATFQRGAWRVTPVSGVTTGVLDDVSCSSATDCVATGWLDTGSSTDGTGGTVLIARRAGATWTASGLAIGTAGSDVDLSGVDCTSALFCQAVGTVDGTAYATATTDGAGWKSTGAVSPAGFPGGSLADIDCPTATSCTAVGTVRLDPYGSAERPVVQRWNGSSWTVQPSPAVQGVLNSVACAPEAPSRCFAVGALGSRYSSGDAPPTPLILQNANGTWKASPTSLGRASSFVPQAVSCLSATSCLAVGQTSPYGGTPVAVRWDGSRWRPTSTAPPLPGGDDVSVELSDVSCVAGVGCRVVGTVTEGWSDQSGVDLLWNGTTWATGPEAPALSAVDCTGADACAGIVGGFTDAGARAAVFDGTTWQTEALPDTSPYGSTTVGGVACRAGLDCVAVGSGPTAFARTAAGWVQQPVNATSSRGSTQLTAVSCAPGGRCVAVGQGDRYLAAVAPTAG